MRVLRTYCEAMVSAQRLTVRDENLQHNVGVVLSRFPSLRAIVPDRFPTDARFEITVEKMAAYSEDRAKSYWHKINLPLALYAHGNFPDPLVRELLGSLLRALNDFCDKFSDLPGARSLLAPLWQNAWQDTPEVWSIASCVYCALCFDATGIEVLGFERRVGTGSRDADITVKLRNGITAHVDVETFHKPEFGDRTDTEVRALFEARALAKADAKFGHLPPGEAGIVAEVAVVSTNDVDRRFERPQVRAPRPLLGRVNQFWMPLRLVGVRAPNLQFILDEL